MRTRWWVVTASLCGAVAVHPLAQAQAQAPAQAQAQAQAPVQAQAPAQAQTPALAPTLTAARVDHAPTIDGRLDDPAWAGARVETRFIQNFPDEGRPPTERTELRVVYDDAAVYVAIRCYDTHPEAIVGRLTRRDRDLDADKITVDLSSKNDKVSAYHFQVNAAGVQLDGLRFNDTDYASDWDGRWYSATTRDALGWTVELEIPLVTLRYSGGQSSFGLQVRRYLARREEIDEWAYVPRTAKGEVSYYGTLDGLAGLNARRLFEILANGSGKLTLRANQAPFDRRALAGNLGADLKLGVTPALTLDGTINPDFGTVEVDATVLNLSTVETYYPEKRPFFLEGADLFATPFKLFYSRRVGAQPPPPTLATTAALTEPVPEGRIWSALKLSGLIGDRLSVAVLDAVTARQDATIARAPGAAAEQLLVEPLSNFGVARLRQDLGAGSSVGVLATAVNRLEPAGAAAPQPLDLCPVPYSTTFRMLDAPAARAGRCTNDAYTGGIDAVARSADGEWGASAQVVGSRIEHGPTRLIPDGTEIGSGTTGVGMIAEAGRYGGEHWLYKIGYEGASPGLQINDAGYLDQANFHDVYGSLEWRTTHPTEHFLAASVEVYLEHRRDWLLKDNLYLDPHVTTSVQLSNFWTIDTELSPWFPRWVEDRETQDGARTERNTGYYAALDVKSDPQKLLVVTASGNILKVWNGFTSIHGTATFSLRPIPALELNLIPDVNLSFGGPRWVDTEPNADASRTYYFSKLDARSFDVTLQGSYTFTRTLSLQAYVQPFVVAGHYGTTIASTATGPSPLLTLDSFSAATLPATVAPDFRDGALNVNLIARWEYLPLSVLWLVFTHSQDETTYDPMEGPARLRLASFAHGPITDVVLLKLSYLWF